MNILDIRSTVGVKTNDKLQALKNLTQPVTELRYVGNLLELLDRPCVAIVGSRKVTPYGRTVTTKIAGDLARAGVVIVSGLAIGVDSIAHQAALDAGGLTIAVLPCGLDHIYPAHHTRLAERIIQQGGVLVTEYNTGAGAPMKHQFIARNRIIASLSQGVLITEAAAKSGSLHTANFALEQGIDVFAVPGNITSATSAGTNQLIKTGAATVTSAQDILEQLNISPNSELIYSAVNTAEASVISSLENKNLSLGQLLDSTKLGLNTLNQTLTTLELQGRLKSDVAGYWYLT